MNDPVLDLNNRHFTYHRGQMTMIGTWVRAENGITPCIVLVRRGAPTHELKPYAIPLTNAWMWELERGDPGHCAIEGADILHRMNIGLTKKSLWQLISFIHDNIGELYSIPPNNQLDEERTPVAEAIVSVNGSKKEVLI